MEIILIKDVSNLGLAGQVLNVAPGFARNFLFPTGKALEASQSNLKSLARKRAEFESRAKEAKDQAIDLKNKLSSLVLTLVRKSGDKGKLYGAVTATDIVTAAEAQGFTIDRKRLRIAEPIKTIGDFEISVRLHQEVNGVFKVKVLSDNPAVAPEASEAKEESLDSTKAPEFE
ncbi:MAG: 50S ribosomal protein L9 [Deltaproteobacteria bacterium]|jgi:large subunit ribosomal protein L9|nr:50S ribosomal protein L9 [Deltaproteobacteria bacterium]